MLCIEYIVHFLRTLTRSTVESTIYVNSVSLYNAVKSLLIGTYNFSTISIVAMDENVFG